MSDLTRRRVWQHSEDVREWIDRTRARMGSFETESPLQAAAALERALDELHVSNEELRSQSDELLDLAEQLDSERQRYQQLFDAAPDAYLVTDRAGLILEANRAAGHLLGVPAAALVRTPLTVFIAPSEQAAFRAQLTRVARSEPIAERETTVQPRGQEAIAVAITASMRSKPGSQQVEVRWLVRDVSDRKRAEANARQLQWEHAARLASEAAERRANFLAQASASLGMVLGVSAVEQRIAELAVSGLVDYCVLDVLHDDGTIRRRAAVHANPARDELMRRLLEHVLRPDAAHGVARVIRTGGTEVETPATDGFASHDGPADIFEQLAPRLQVIVPLRARGRVLGALTLGIGEGEIWGTNPLAFAESFADRAALALDNAGLLEEVVTARDLAERANESKAQFLATLSHEFRTPLTAVIGYSELLLAGVPEKLPDRLAVYVDRIRASASHQLALVEQILDYARLEGGSQHVQLGPVDFYTVAREAADLVRPDAAAVGFPVRVECAQDSVRGYTDEGKLRQILGNLLANAVQFTKAGEVRVEIAESGDGAVFQVSDTGPGVPADQLARIFDRFWQASPGRGRGVGLGLNITRQLVLLLGGEIGVKSTVGQGTTFTVRIPLRHAAAPAQQ